MPKKVHNTITAKQGDRTVEAMQYTGKNRNELVEWSGRQLREGLGGALDVHCAHGLAPLRVGDWLVLSKPHSGIYHPVTKETFNNCYLEVPRGKRV